MVIKIQFLFLIKSYSTVDMPVCEITFDIKEKLPRNSYIYYELDNFYMNHRDFVKSRLYPQIRGEQDINSNKNSQCKGGIYMKDIYGHVNSNKTYHIEKKKMGREKDLKPDDFAIPCGLIAKAFFNDEYSLIEKKTGFKIDINEKGIANNYDKDFMFNNYENWKEKQWLDMTDGKIYLISKMLKYY